ncbi:hypothetical protein IU397_01295 [Actibacterium sp. 188UL27-1]|nr:hypothetical protein [Actibacterium sp. 188UL27-1]MBM7066220.1 hypothetical protein [Actibacterium sp. 188UL27-1]
MSFIADLLLIAAAGCAALYCFVLSRKLKKFTNLEQGMGGAVAVLSVQVDDLTKALKGAQQTAAGSAKELKDLTARAEAATSRLELLLASTHDLPKTSAEPRKVRRVRRKREQDSLAEALV